MPKKITNTPAPAVEPESFIPAETPGLITIGLDIGYGAVKVQSDDDKSIVFPSVWGHAREVKFGTEKLAADYPGDQLTDDDGSWFIGELAQSQLKPAETLQLRGRTANEAEIGNVARLRLAKAALAKLLPGKRNGVVTHVRIATGLPVDHMAGAAALKEALIGVHQIKTDNSDFVINITEVMVMPQPYGTIYANTLTPGGEINPCHTATRTAVIDVGTFSIDLAVDDAGEFIDAESGSVEGGIHLAQERIANFINQEYGEVPRPGLVDQILRTKCLKIKGKKVDLTTEVEEAYNTVRAATVAKVNALWGAAAFLDVIYLSGGGASIVQTAVSEAGYSQAQLVQDAQLANARGYLNYAKWRER